MQEGTALAVYLGHLNCPAAIASRPGRQRAVLREVGLVMLDPGALPPGVMACLEAADFDLSVLHVLAIGAVSQSAPSP